MPIGCLFLLPVACVQAHKRITVKNSQIMFIISDMWCGIVDNCVAKENKNVTVGCYASYEWLAYYLNANPIVGISTSLQWTEDPSSFRGWQKPDVISKSQNLQTTTTFLNVQPGEIITAECRVDHHFSEKSFKPKNTYAINPLHHSCFVNQTVHCKCFRFSPHLLWLSLYILVDRIKIRLATIVRSWRIF